MFFKSPTDRFTWLVLVVVFISAFVSVGLNFKVIHQLQQQQVVFHDENIQAQKVIVTNQKTYINCLLGINPKGDIPMQEKACFNQT